MSKSVDDKQRFDTQAGSLKGAAQLHKRITMVHAQGFDGGTQRVKASVACERVL